jgi:hypothetical protein
MAKKKAALQPLFLHPATVTALMALVMRRPSSPLDVLVENSALAGLSAFPALENTSPVHANRCHAAGQFALGFGGSLPQSGLSTWLTLQSFAGG